MSEIYNFALVLQKIIGSQPYIYHGLEQYGDKDRYFFRRRLCVLEGLASALGVHEIDGQFVHERIAHIKQPVSETDDFRCLHGLSGRQQIKIAERNVLKDWRRIRTLYEQIQGSGNTILGNALQRYSMTFNCLPALQVSEFVSKKPHEAIVHGIIKVRDSWGSHSFHAKTDSRKELHSMSERGKRLSLHPDTYAMVVTLSSKK